MPLDPNAVRSRITKFSFHVQIGGITYAGFAKMGEINVEFERIDIREGGNPFPVTMPGTGSLAEVTLERGEVAADSDLYEWIKETGDSRTQLGLADEQYKRDLDVVCFNAAKVPQERIRLFKAWCRAYKIGDFDTSASEVLMTAVTIVFESFDRKKL